MFIGTILLRYWIDAYQREEAYQRGEMRLVAPLAGGGE